MKQSRALTEVLSDLRRFISSSGLKQEALAHEMGVSQSTICRILGGRERDRPSEALRKICKYAKINLDVTISDGTKDPRQNQDLMDALTETWDGTAPHAKALARTIRTLKPLRFK